MRFLKFWGNKRHKENYRFSIELYEPVLARIYNSLRGSNIEEGGKFLGTIREDGANISIKVYSYIDAGPMASNSQTHIIPDGEHQESLFRIIERYDPHIEHIGSWHSHHCNGYQELSNGDIQGYFHNVNDEKYNLDWFFALLVTNVTKHGVAAKYFVFHREDENIYTVAEESVIIADKKYKYENVLREFELSTYAYRGQSQQFDSYIYEEREARDWTDLIVNIRAEDRAWIKENFHTSEAFKGKKGNIQWRWNIPNYQGDLIAAYTYPSDFEANQDAILVIKYGGKEVLRNIITLDDSRFEKIIESIKKAKKVVDTKMH